MEIKINPNWSSESYIKVNGQFSAYQVGNPTPDSFWFFSSVSFGINERIRITQGTNISICQVTEVTLSPFFLPYNVIVKRITGSPNLQTITQIDSIEDDISFYLDGTIDLALNLRILDLKELKRSSSFTKTIEVPFTENNNKIFTQIFNVNVSEGFNPKKKSDCTITDGGVLISSGYIQVQSIDPANKVYKCVFYGENKNLFDDIGDNYIYGNQDATKDVNIDKLIHNKYKADFDKAWTGVTDYNYGLFTTDTDVYTLNYLTAVGATAVGVEPFRWKPLVRSKAMFDAIFNKWGYTYESDFLTTDERFTEMFVLPSLEPTPGGVILKYKQTDPPTPWTINRGVDEPLQLYVKDIDPWNNKYDFGTNRFTVPYTDTWRASFALTLNVRARVPFPATSTGRTQRNAAIDKGEIGVKVYRRGILIDRIIIRTLSGEIRDTFGGGGGGQGGGGGRTITSYGYVPIGGKYSIDGYQFNNRFNAGDELEFFVNIFKSDFATYTVNGNFNFTDNKVDFVALLNDAITTNLISLFNGIKQTDFIGDMFKMFNLYIMPDKLNPRKFLIEPRDDFYRKGTAINNLEWDVNSAQISYLNDLASKKYIFTYTKGEDEFNKSFSQANRDRVYGDAIIVIDNDFLSAEKKVVLSGVSTTLSAADTTNNILLSNLKGAPQKDKMRYFYWGGMINSDEVLKYQFYSASVTNLATYTYSSYPGWSNYSLFADNNSDSLLFAENSSGEKEPSLYYNYYENEIETYADPGSHILTIDVRMNTKVFSSIDYNDIFYLEVNGNPHYYTLLSIDNYKPDQTEMVKMKLMSYYDFRSNKPKRSRPFWDVANGSGGDMPVKNGVIGDIKPGGGGISTGNGGIKNGGVGVVNGAVIAGTDVALAGNNKNILAIGDKITIAEGVSNTFIFGENGGLVTSSNVVSFGGGGKTFSTPDTFNFNSYNPVLEEKDPDTITYPVDGMLAYSGTASGIKVYGGGTWSNLPSGSSGSSGSSGTSGTSGNTTTSDNYNWFATSNTALGTASAWIQVDSYSVPTGGNWLIVAQVYCGDQKSPDTETTFSVRVSDGTGLYYSSAQNTVKYTVTAFTTLNISTIVNLSLGATVYLEAKSDSNTGNSSVFSDLQIGTPTIDKATQWSFVRLT